MGRGEAIHVRLNAWGVNVAVEAVDVELGSGPAVAESLHTDVPRMLDAFGSAGGDRDREAIQCLDAADRLAPQYV